MIILLLLRVHLVLDLLRLKVWVHCAIIRTDLIGVLFNGALLGGLTRVVVRISLRGKSLIIGQTVLLHEAFVTLIAHDSDELCCTSMILMGSTSDMGLCLAINLGLLVFNLGVGSLLVIGRYDIVEILVLHI